MKARYKIVGASLLVLVFCSGAPGDDKAPDKKASAVNFESLPRPTKFEEQLLAALEKPVEVDFLNLPLEDCLTYLHEHSKIPFWLDRQTLTDEGVALDQPITLKLKGSRLESVLNLLLKPVQLTFLPEDDVLIITTTAKAADKLITRTYPVSDLYPGRVEAVAKDEGVVVAPKPAPVTKPADLIKAITTTVEPDCWEDRSGPGTYTYVKETGCLVIRQTWAVHRKVLQLLRDLREAKRLVPGGKAATPASDGKGPSSSGVREQGRTETNGRDSSFDIEFLPRPSKFEVRFLAALEKPVTVEFLDLAIEDCLHHLQKAADIPIWIDRQTLADEGIALHQPGTLKLKDSRLKSALHLLLNPQQMAFIPQDDVLVITTSAKVSENLITRTYPVGDLFQGRAEGDVYSKPQKIEADLRQMMGAGFYGIASRQLPPWSPESGSPDSGDIRQIGAGHLDVQQGKQLAHGFVTDGGAVKSATRQKRHADLVDAIANTIEPYSWEDLAGPGTYSYVQETDCLVIRQTWAVHRQILQLLRDLRSAQDLLPAASEMRK